MQYFQELQSVCTTILTRWLTAGRGWPPGRLGIDEAGMIDFYCCYADLLGAANE